MKTLSFESAWRSHVELEGTKVSATPGVDVVALFTVTVVLVPLPGFPVLLTVFLGVCTQVAVYRQAQRKHRCRWGAGGLGAVLHPILHGVPGGGGPVQVGFLCCGAVRQKEN